MAKIECLDCGYIGAPDIEDDGENGIWWCPECESLYLLILEEPHKKDNCTANDLIIVSEGLQCGNCLALVKRN